MKLGAGVLVATLVLMGGQAMALTVKDRTLAQVACETARGNLAALERAYAEAFAAGWTVQEMKVASAHFQAYKQGTLHMVKRLDLVDMDPLDPEGMSSLFRKRTGGVS